MKKVVRLKESELVSLIKRVLKEDGGLDGIMNKVPAGSKGQGTPGGSQNPAPVDNSQSKTFPDEPKRTSIPVEPTKIIKIKIQSEFGEELYFDITKTNPKINGCSFTAQGRSSQGERPTVVDITWIPSKRLEVTYSLEGIPNKGYRGTISSAAADLLENACGNQGYASKMGGGSTNYA